MIEPLYIVSHPPPPLRPLPSPLVQEEAAHPRFVRMHARASYALLALTCVQWPSFLLAAFFFYKDEGACFSLGLVGPNPSLSVSLTPPIDPQYY